MLLSFFPVCHFSHFEERAGKQETVESSLEINDNAVKLLFISPTWFPLSKYRQLEKCFKRCLSGHGWNIQFYIAVSFAIIVTCLLVPLPLESGEVLCPCCHIYTKTKLMLFMVTDCKKLSMLNSIYIAVRAGKGAKFTQLSCLYHCQLGMELINTCNYYTVS